MPLHKESEAKKTVRLLLRDACEALQRGKLTYLGLPSDSALDLHVLSSVLENVICVDIRKATLDETRRSIAHLSIKQRKFIVGDIWEYLRDGYPSDPFTADLTFLDFYGGGIRKGDPFAEEIAGLRSYFAKQAKHPNKAFILAWTYMPRDRGKNMYLDTCAKIIPLTDLDLLKQSKGIWARSVAIRLLLRQSFKEHGMVTKIFHHAVYKTTMNAIILIFSRGNDHKCTIPLGDPDTLLEEPVCVYDAIEPVPQIVAFPSIK